MRTRRNRGKPRFSNRLPQGLSEHFLKELASAIPDEGFKTEYLKKEYLSKYLDPKVVSPGTRRANALEKWLSAERQNQKTNVRLLFHEDDTLGWITLPAFVKGVRSLVSDILGPLEYPQILMRESHSNGASTRIHRSPKASIDKLGGKVHISESCLKHWFACFQNTLLSNQEIEIRNSSTFFTVPKKSDIDRVACKEPEGNVVLQRSVGSYIKQRLKRVGIDLYDQSRNQELARHALKRNLATIDLSAASDSITEFLVKLFLPDDWYSLLDDLRVRSVYIDKELHIFEMFSSMGNGFTFELESLIFYAMTRTICRKSGVKGTISVFGDDIIAPCNIVPRLKRVFSYFGFRTNAKKTFYRGPFRESCGKHFWHGVDVSPFYIRKAIRTKLELIKTLNQILEWDGRGWGFFLTEELQRLHVKYSKYIDRQLHGGIHPEDSSALVTGDFPCKRAVPLTRPMKFDQNLGLISWHFARSRVEYPLEICPQHQFGYKLVDFVHLGERTSWSPYLLYSR